MLEEMWFALVYVRTVSDQDAVRVTPVSFIMWAAGLGGCGGCFMQQWGFLKAVHADGRKKERPVAGFIPTVYIW